MKSFSLFLAIRYLKPKRAFLSIITLVSVLGVTLAITVLIVVIAVMTGFDHELQRKILGFEPHITVSAERPLHGWENLAANIRQQPGVVTVAPYVQGPVFADSGSRIGSAEIRGIDPVEELKINDLKSLIKDGKFDLNGDVTVMGQGLADSLGLSVGDKVTVYATNNIQGIISELRKEENDPKSKPKTLLELKNEIVLPADLTVTGIFKSGFNDYDANVMLVPLYIGQELWGLQGDVHGLSVETTDPYLAQSVKDDLDKRLHAGAYAETWMELHSDRFGAVKVERNVMFIILMFLVVIAAFCVMNTLITVTVQKRREIGILKALGANIWQIIWVFFAQGMIVGFFGNITGVALGMTMIHFRNPFKEWLATTLHIQLFPASIYEFSEIPAQVVPRDVAIICVSAFVVCSIAALIPAYFAARLDPVKALRYE